MQTEMKDNTKELNMKELEQVNGGCVFYHTYSPDGMELRLDDGTYTEWICKDCGDRRYTKNGKDISKEEFEAARKRFDGKTTEHYYIDFTK